MERTGRKDNGASWRGVPARRMVGRPPVETEMNKDKAMQQALEQPPLPVQEPAACRFCHSKKGCWTWQCYKCGETKPLDLFHKFGLVHTKTRKGDSNRCLVL